MAIVILAIIALGFILYFVKFNSEIGKTSIGIFASIALIFTSSLDLGIIMLPPVMDLSPVAEVLGIANSTAVEISLWVGLIWLVYLAAVMYFRWVEPKYKFLDNSMSNFFYTFAVFFTYAFSVQLFIDTLPNFTLQNPYLWTGIALIIAFIMTKWEGFRSACSKLMVVGILCLPVFALVVGGTYDPTVVLDLPKAQIMTFTQWNHPDVSFFILWWGAWMLPQGKYINESITKTKIKYLGLWIVLAPLIFVVPWLSIDISIAQIVSNPYMFYYFLILATLYLATSIVSMVFNTGEYFERHTSTKNHKSLISIGLVALVTLVIYLIHIPLEFILSLYGLSLIIGIIYYFIKKD